MEFTKEPFDMNVDHIYTQSQKKRNFYSWIFPGAQGQGHVTLDHNPRFTGIQSSPKERQLQKSCVSFEKECTTRTSNPFFYPNLFGDEIGSI